MVAAARSEPASSGRVRGRSGESYLGYLWWALLVVPLWIVLILCTHWEPVMRDGWGHLFWHGDHTVDLATIYDTAKEAYRAENPRLGQLMTLLSYTPGPFHPIITPIVELSVFALLTALVLGRWPSVRRPDDALSAALVTAVVLTCVPQIGAMLFYRPFVGNYTFGLALNLLWLLPYRLEVAGPRAQRIWLVPVAFVTGLAAGLCNEHTGIAFLAMGVLASLAVARRGGWRSVRIWMLGGLVGLTIGYVLLLIAPGQHRRYSGLADQAGIIARITDRGLTGNLGVLGALALALVAALPLVAIGLVERSRRGPVVQPVVARWTQMVLALAGVACTLTLLGSPKIGPRLYLASVALIAAGLVGWLVVQLRSAWARRLCGALAAAVLVYVGARLVMIHRVVGPLGVIRVERLQRARPDTIVTIPAYPFDVSRYFLGDDFRSPELREIIRSAYGLKALEIEPAASR